MRHPIYLGILLMVLGLALWSQSPLRILLTVLLAVFFDRKALHEEAWLVARYPEYHAYRARTKKLIPWIY